MFIVKRINKDGDYRVWSCDSYRVEGGDKESYGSPMEMCIFHGGQQSDRFCIEGAVVYVMNENGRTIDTIDRRQGAPDAASTGSVSCSGG
jgi:hypothetical protein